MAGLTLIPYSSIMLTAEITQAQNVSEEKIVTFGSSKLLEETLESLELGYQKLDNGVYSFPIGQYKAIVFHSEKDIQLYIEFTGIRVTLNEINEWNKNKRFSRAYINEEGNPVLAADLDLEAGVYPPRFRRFIIIIIFLVKEFVEFHGQPLLWEHPILEKTLPNKRHDKGFSCL
ncbi:MAG: YbjN domain-containing protein [Symploca sp. SIO2E6]|nr:YbjN domain-containing protein [Symploca sp. SIO2E6]